MRVPGVPSIFFLVFLLVFLPWAALRSASRLRRALASGAPLPAELSRPRMLAGTLYVQVLLMVLAWIAGSSFDFSIFALPPSGRIGVRAVLIGGAALAVCFGLRSLLRAWRSEAERRDLIVYRLAPRGGLETALWVVAVLAAGVAEEAAYRGVGMAILWYSFGNPWAAAAVCAAAFALAHSLQGWRSGVVIFAVALVFHALVALTGTLLVAMAVHAIYDLVAGYLLRREALRFDAEAAAPGV